MDHIKSIYNDNDEVHKMRLECQTRALADEMLTCFKIGSLEEKTIDELYEMATKEIFTEHEKNAVIKKACDLLLEKNNIEIISVNPLKFNKKQ